MTGLCLDPSEKARKAHARVLQAMQTPGKGGALAVGMGSSDSAVSRLKNEHMQPVLQMLYMLGFKVVSGDKVCVAADELAVLKRYYVQQIAREQEAAQLFGDDE